MLRRIGASDLWVYPVALSGKAFGWTADHDAAMALMDRYAEAGGNFLDTADSYAGGRSEVIIGNWLARSGRRDEMVVATKVGKNPDHPGLSAAAVIGAVTDSLLRLQSDHIDLLYLHIDDRGVPFEETLLAVDELIRAGKVRHFGASHHTADRLLQARIASVQLEIARMVALQNQYNLAFREEYESSLARAARDLGLGVMPRFALASGFLTGRYRTRAEVAASPRARDLAPYFTRAGLRILTAMDAVSAATGASLATIALAWLLAKPGIVAPVVSATRADQVEELVAATTLELSAEHIATLDRASRWR